jgi:large subunit ribosomal protein L6
MSRVGNKPIALPNGVTVTTKDREVTVKGPKGELKYEHRPEVAVELEGTSVVIKNMRPARDREARAFHGLTRALLQNMVIGVSQGYERKLEINGVGYNAKLEGKTVVLNLGFANQLRVPVPATVECEVPSQTSIVVRGCDKQKVGEFAASIRRLRPPEPYKGKGIKYDDEVIRRKAGKAMA